MNFISIFLVLFSAAIPFQTFFTTTFQWETEYRKEYQVYYSLEDKIVAHEIVEMTDVGIKIVNDFFQDNFKVKFKLYIHPNRKSLDSTWQSNWQMPNFKSECWMVGSGTAVRFDLLSPSAWINEACEHDPADLETSSKLITHELVHVYHGQCNPSPDFSSTNGLDWFIEGLATYVSGQYDNERRSEVKNAIVENKIPPSLEHYWTGTLRYGICGSIVQYIASEYNEDLMHKLLVCVNLNELLDHLETTEEELIQGWKSSMTGK
jgi:hypothetical protein